MLKNGLHSYTEENNTINLIKIILGNPQRVDKRKKITFYTIDRTE